MLTVAMALAVAALVIAVVVMTLAVAALMVLAVLMMAATAAFTMLMVVIVAAAALVALLLGVERPVETSRRSICFLGIEQGDGLCAQLRAADGIEHVIEAVGGIRAGERDLVVLGLLKRQADILMKCFTMKPGFQSPSSALGASCSMAPDLPVPVRIMSRVSSRSSPACCAYERASAMPTIDAASETWLASFAA